MAELGASAVLSSHLLADVERVCDYLIVLRDSRVRVAGDVRDLLDAGGAATLEELVLGHLTAEEAGR